MTEPENPPHWQAAMDKVGLSSRTRLGVAAGVPTSTITGLITGDRRSSDATMQAVADALRVEITTIRQWAAQARGELEPYVPPAEANQLSRRQRRALDELIRSITAAAADEATRGQLVDLARPPQPDLSRVAARHRQSEGRRRRREQDEDSDRP